MIARVAVLREAVRYAPGWSVVLILWAVVSVALPLAVLVAMGLVAARVPAAVHAPGSPAERALIEVLVALGVFYVASVVVDRGRSIVTSTLRVRLTTRAQEELMSATDALPSLWLLHTPAVQERVDRARGSLQSHDPAEAASTLVAVVGNRCIGLGACLALSLFHWWLGLVVVALWSLVRPFVLHVVRRQVRASRGEAEEVRRADYFLRLGLAPGAAKERCVFGLRDWTVGAFRGHWLAGMAESWRLLARLHRTVAVLGVLVLGVYAAVAGTIAASAFDGRLSLGGLVLLLPMLAMSMLWGAVSFDDIALEWMCAARPDVAGVRAALHVTEPPVTPDAVRSARGLPVEELRLEKVSFRHGAEAPVVLEDVDLRFPVGTSTALVGTNGTGKTTIVKLLAGLWQPTAGRVLADGVPIGDLRDWPRQCAVVFQDFVRYPYSVSTNVALGASEHLDDHDGVRRAARRAGAVDLVEALPQGWDTLLSARLPGGHDLSGGEWQRVALARALFAVEHGARILVLDEPTAHLDAYGEAEFYENFLALTQGVTSVIVSHRFSTVRQADAICVLGDGGIVERGDHDLLVTSGGVYHDLFRAQTERFASGVRP